MFSNLIVYPEKTQMKYSGVCVRILEENIFFFFQP